MVFPIHLTGNQLSSNSQNAITLAKSKALGEFKQGKVIYSNYEALYLIENKNAELIKTNKKIPANQSQGILLKNKEEQNKYLVYLDLRKKGLVPKTGMKFGADFRVYEKNKSHATYLVFITTEKSKLEIKELLSKTRISHSTAKKLLIAVIDSQEDVTYIEADWKRL
ncbi:MAG: tRNA-intron lyase [Nanoarchaeota archaeon]